MRRLLNPRARARTRDSAREDHELDPYLTDGHSLFRIVSGFSPGDAQPWASLENCKTLEVRPYSPDELYAMGLRRVRKQNASPHC